MQIIIEGDLQSFTGRFGNYRRGSTRVDDKRRQDKKDRLDKKRKIYKNLNNAGKQGSEGFARISYAYSVKHISEALERIEKFIKKL